jgi:regulator of protease activity HflC (stomatin/prohibitin superfamily)
MLDKLVEVILSFLELFKFWDVLNVWEQGVKTRLGKYPKPVQILEAGFHWKLPFNIDEIHTVSIARQAIELGSQTITTKDEKCIVLEAVLTYEVKDVERALFKVGDEISAVKERIQSIIRYEIVKTDFSEINNEGIEESINEKSKKEGNKWGIKVISVSIKSLGKITSIRLINQ